MKEQIANDMDFVLDWIARVENEFLRQEGKLSPRSIKDESIRLGGIPGPKGEKDTTQKGETTMENDLLVQRRYLRNRLAEVYSEKRSEARKQFAIDNQDAPKNWQDLQDRIASGKFVLDTDAEKTNKYGPFYNITWRDPAVPADRVSYDAWKVKAKAAGKAVEDDILVKDPTAALESLRAYEVATLA